MGLFNIYRLCASVLFVASLVLSSTVSAVINEVSVEVRPTTSHYSITTKTVRPPTGTTVSTFNPNPPVVSRIPNGGLSQTVGGGITINSIERTAPLSARLNAYLPTLKAGAKKAIKGGIAGIVITEALQMLLDDLGAFIDDAGKINRKTGDDIYGDTSDYLYFRSGYRTNSGTARDDKISSGWLLVGSATYNYWPFNNWYLCEPSWEGFPLSGWDRAGGGVGGNCLFGGTPNITPAPSVAVPDIEVETAVDSGFAPNPEDWDWLTGYMKPDTIEITSLPSLSMPPKTTTVYDADGNPHSVQETNTWYDFDVKNNNSTKPEIDMKKTEETTTFENGVNKGTTSTTTTNPAQDSATAESSPPRGVAPAPEIPTDCDFHPTLCAWMDWTKQNDLDDEPDLSQIMHEFEPTNTNFSVTGSKSCPAPYSIHVGLVDRTYELSFEPACTFAGYLYFLVMAGAYIFAAYITLGVARNG